MTNTDTELIYKNLFGKEWWEAMKPHFSEDYFIKLGQFINKERETKSVLPEQSKVFRAFIDCPFNEVKVIVLGLDPYIKKEQACGLAFAIEDDCTMIPASLKFIAEEVERSLYDGMNLSFDYSLQNWVKQGVLLINTALTVVEGKTGSHSIMWREFTEMIFKTLSAKNRIVFLLLGKQAQEYKRFILPKHPVVEAPHPAAASYNPKISIVGSNCFVKVNEELSNLNYNEIKW